jgi:hypothetical protein
MSWCIIYSCFVIVWNGLKGLWGLIFTDIINCLSCSVSICYLLVCVDWAWRICVSILHRGIQRQITNHKINNLLVVGCVRVLPEIILKSRRLKWSKKIRALEIEKWNNNCYRTTYDFLQSMQNSRTPVEKKSTGSTYLLLCTMQSKMKL